MRRSWEVSEEWLNNMLRYMEYTGIAMKGYVHRLVDHKKEFVSKGVHINGLEGF